MAEFEMSKCVHVAENYIRSKSLLCVTEKFGFMIIIFLRAIRVLGCFDQWW